MRLTLFCLFLTASPLALAQQPAASAAEADSVARQIAGAGSTADRTARLVRWINTNFDWSYTDYVNRTVDEIIARRAGNCADLSRVLARLLEANRIRYRWIAEINIQPLSSRRQENAARLIATRGPALSVFGLRHNDHRWLEAYEEGTNTWIPADPSVGVVGVEQWVRFRLSLKRRPKPSIPQVAATVADMIVPFAVLATPTNKGGEYESRTEFYLVEQFNKCYHGRLAALPAWKDWTDSVGSLSVFAARAFAGKENLHEHGEEINRLAVTYMALQQQAERQGVADNGCR